MNRTHTVQRLHCHHSHSYRFIGPQYSPCVCDCVRHTCIYYTVDSFLLANVLTNCPHQIRKHNSGKNIEERNATINNPSIERTEKLLVASFLLLLLFSRLHWIENSWDEKNVHIFRLMRPKQQKPTALSLPLSLQRSCRHLVVSIMLLPCSMYRSDYCFGFNFFYIQLKPLS